MKTGVKIKNNKIDLYGSAMMKIKKLLGGLVIFACLFMVLGLAVGAQNADLAFQDNDTLEMIQQKIERNGYQFTVGHNWVFDMTREQKQAFFSRRPTLTPRVYSVADDIGPLADELGKTLPAAFDWRNIDGHTYIGPVRNQGNCGSCYSFGASAAAEGVYNFANGLTDAACADFSESFIIWCLSRISPYGDHFFGCGGADYDYMELEALVQEGTINESYFPYTVSDPVTCTHYGDPRIKFAEWHRIPCSDIAAIKTAIMTYGVVDVAVNASSAFSAYSSGIYDDSNTACSSSPCDYTPTNHAVALVGWDDADGVWILRNSWGSSWGENGYMRIKYTAARVACEATYLVYRVVPGITVTSPSSSSSWEVGTSQNIAWNVSGSLDANVKIELYRGGAKALDIATSTANDGGYGWTIPTSLTAASDYSVRVTTADAAYSDDSGLFTITVTPPSITVTAPAVGANWNVGTTQAITWTKAGALDANVKIELWQNGAKALDIAASTANDGSYEWLLPTSLTGGNNYLVRVTTADAAYSDDSGLFTISTAPSITVTSPAAGAVWKRNSLQNILWTKTGSQGLKVRIRLYRNGVQKKVIILTTPNDGAFSWKVGGALPTGAGYQILVNTVDGKVSDFSDSFSIN
jgi:C1A family cysteine protease